MRATRTTVCCAARHDWIRNPSRGTRTITPRLPPWELTYRDAMALRASDIPTRQLAMFKAYVHRAARARGRASLPRARARHGRRLLRSLRRPLPLRLGLGRSMDEAAEQVVVLDKETNDEIFGGENSVGRETRHERAQVQGRRACIDDWRPSPVYYDVNNGAFDESEEVFVPFTHAVHARAGFRGQHELLEAGADRLLRGLPQLRVRVAPVLGAARQRRISATRYQSLPRQLRQRAEEARTLRAPAQQQADARERLAAASARWPATTHPCWSVCPSCSSPSACSTPWACCSRSSSARRRRSACAARSARRAGRSSASSSSKSASSASPAASLGLALAWLGLLGVQALLEELRARYAHLDFNMLGAGLAIALARELRGRALYPTWRVCRMSPAPFLKTQ